MDKLSDIASEYMIPPEPEYWFQCEECGWWQEYTYAQDKECILCNDCYEDAKEGEEEGG